MKNQRVLLIQPPNHPHSIIFGIMEPLALELLAAGIKKDDRLKDTEIKILDLRVEKGLEKKLQEFKPDIVGVTGITIDYPMAVETLKTVKRVLPKTFTVVGGHHATMCPKDFFLPEIDFIVTGPGIRPLQKIIFAIENDENFSLIEGVSYQRGGKFFINSSGNYTAEINFYETLFPDRNLTKNYRKKYKFDGFTYGVINTAWGCTHRCTFCACWKAAGGKYVGRRPEDVVEELTQIPEKRIFIGDDHTFGDIKRAEKIYELIKEKGIKKIFQAYSRADTIVRHPDIFRKWKSIGLFALTVGVEALTDEELEKFNKKGTIKINEEANRILLDCGIHNYAHILIRPDFNEKDFQKAINYTLKLGIAHPVFPTLTPLPGTQLHREQIGVFYPNEYQYYDLAHPLTPLTLKSEDFYKQLFKLYEKNYSFKRWMVCNFKKFANFVCINEIYPKIQTNAPEWYTIPLVRMWLKKEFKKINYFLEEFKRDVK